MPIYEYQCGACGRRHEALQGVREPPLRECPHCGKPELVKLISAAGFRLAGSGWYETDFKTGDKRNLAASPDAKSEAKSESKSESKDAGGKSGTKGGGDKPSAAGRSSSGQSSSGQSSSGQSSSGQSSSGKPSQAKTSSDKPSSSGGA